MKYFMTMMSIVLLGSVALYGCGNEDCPAPAEESDVTEAVEEAEVAESADTAEEVEETEVAPEEDVPAEETSAEEDTSEEVPEDSEETE